MQPLILSVDLGTTSIKQALIDTQGQIHAMSVREYTLSTPKPSWVECSAKTYWDAFTSGLAECLDKCPNAGQSIVAIGISAQGETLFCLDEAGAPLRDAIVWMDNRAVREADALVEAFSNETCYKTTGQVSFDPCWPAAKILWLKNNEPETFKKTATYALIEDWFIHELTSEMVSEGSLLCSTVYWNIITKQWWGEMLDYLGISDKQLPRIMEPGQKVAKIKKEVAEALGINPDAVVCTGVLDQAAGAIGVGNIHQGLFSENIGAALAICAPVDKPLFDPNQKMPLHYFGIPDMYMLHTFTTGGMAIKWYRDSFCEMEKCVAEACGSSAYALMDAEAEKVAPGSDGLVALPHLGGSMAPDVNPLAKGVFFGFTLKHTKAHFARAIMESIGYIVRRNLDALADIGLVAEEIRSLGGGSKSPLWNQIKSDINGIPLTLMNAPEAACLGAAIVAGTAVGLFPSVEAACASMVKPMCSYAPNKENASVYEKGYEVYKKVFASLSDAFEFAAEEE